LIRRYQAGCGVACTPKIAARPFLIFNAFMTGNSGTRSSVICSEVKAGAYRVGFITLDNPRSLNALDLNVFEKMEAALLQWRRRGNIACVVLHARSEKAFCAGGDVKALVSGLLNGPGIQMGAEFFTAEYFIDYLIHVFEKPILCWADGIAMGGGIGIMNGACSRVVTERTLMAMPESAIGLFPDVGGTYFLNRLPEGLALFLALTSARFNGADAVAIGMADHWIPSHRKAEALTGLGMLPWTHDDQRNKQILEDYLSSFADPGAARRSELMRRMAILQSLTSYASVEQIDQALRGWRGDDPWVTRAVAGYLGASPTSVKAVFKQITEGKHLSKKAAFLREWDMALNFCAGSDFPEGVRARLIHKDQQPRWNPATLAELKDIDIEQLFSKNHGQGDCLEQKFSQHGLS
jgi:enoyl-CoA hydratase/carnithine racemase